MQLVGVFNIHDFITDVIGSLYEIGQRITHVAFGSSAVILQTDNAQITGYSFIVMNLAFKKAELGTSARHH